MALSVLVEDMERRLAIADASDNARRAGAALGNALRWDHPAADVERLERELSAAKDALARAKSLCG